MFAQMAAESSLRSAEAPSLAQASSMESEGPESQVNSETSAAVHHEAAGEAGSAAGGEDVIFETDPRSRKARVKNSEALMALCSRHKKTLDRSNLRVCEGRKVVYLLAEGDITHPCCFFKESPTPSHRSKGSATPTWVPPKEVTWNSVMIPDGWKVGVVVDGDPWTAETCVIEGCIKYRFTFVDQQGREVEAKRSEWCETPGAAFKSLFCRVHPNKDVGRHNGKLYIGCHYDSVQDHLRNFFKKKKEAGAYDGEGKMQIKALLEQWILNEPLDVITRKPLKRFANIRGPVLPPHFKRMRRQNGDLLNGSFSKGGGEAGSAGAEENDVYGDLHRVIHTDGYYSNKDVGSIVNAGDANQRRSRQVFQPSPQSANGAEHPPENLDQAFRFVLTAHPAERFAVEEIYSIVRLELAKDGKLYPGDGVQLESVRQIFGKALQLQVKPVEAPPGEQGKEDQETTPLCTMFEYFQVQASLELSLLDAILARAKELDEDFHASLESALNKLRKSYVEYVAQPRTETETDLNNIRLALADLDLVEMFRWELMKDDGDGLQLVALHAFVSLVKDILGVPHALGLRVPMSIALKNPQRPQELYMGAMNIWDEIARSYAARLRDDARAGLGLLFSNEYGKQQNAEATPSTTSTEFVSSSNRAATASA